MTDSTSAVIRSAARGGNIFGIVTIIFGVLCMAAPLVTGLAIATLVGIIILLAGVAQLVFAFRAPSLGQGILVFLFGGIGVLAGGAVIAQPKMGLATIALVLAVYFVVDGISTIFTGWRLRPAPGSGWMIFSGATTLLLGILIWRNWPLSGAWAVGILVGIRLLMRGWSMIALSAVGIAAAESLDEDER